VSALANITGFINPRADFDTIVIRQACGLNILDINLARGAVQKRVHTEVRAGNI
jgi:hypothetical protein